MSAWLRQAPNVGQLEYEVYTDEVLPNEVEENDFYISILNEQLGRYEREHVEEAVYRDFYERDGEESVTSTSQSGSEESSPEESSPKESSPKETTAEDSPKLESSSEIQPEDSEIKRAKIRNWAEKHEKATQRQRTIQQLQIDIAEKNAEIQAKIHKREAIQEK